MRAPTPAIRLIGPERILVPGNLTKDGYLQVMHMYPNGSAAKGIAVSKFCVCIGVYDAADADLYGEIVGLRQPLNRRRFAQSWTSDSFVQAGRGAKSNSKNRADLVLWDVELLQFVYNEITSDWLGVKKSERFDVACEILQNVVGHVVLGRTDARQKIKKLLIDSTELQDSLHRLNPRANALRISAAIPQFLNQSHFDSLSERSLENAFQVSLLLQKQIAAYLDYLKWCVRYGIVPTRYAFNTIYQVMDIKPYSYALSYVRYQKAQKGFDDKSELILLHDTLSVEYRLSMVSSLCGQLKRSPGCHDTTIEEMISTALINRNEFMVYLTTIRGIRKHWQICKQQILAGEEKLAAKSLQAMQNLIRVRMVEVDVDGDKQLVRASSIEGHPWHVDVLDYSTHYASPNNPFQGLPQ